MNKAQLETGWKKCYFRKEAFVLIRPQCNWFLTGFFQSSQLNGNLYAISSYGSVGEELNDSRRFFADRWFDDSSFNCASPDGSNDLHPPKKPNNDLFLLETLVLLYIGNDGPYTRPGFKAFAVKARFALSADIVWRAKFSRKGKTLFFDLGADYML